MRMNGETLRYAADRFAHQEGRKRSGHNVVSTRRQRGKSQWKDRPLPEVRWQPAMFAFTDRYLAMPIGSLSAAAALDQLMDSRPLGKAVAP